MKDCDLLIVGSGLAGLTAGMVGAQHGLSVLIVDQMGTAGQVLTVDRIDNMPGLPDGIAGYELGPMLQSQAETAGCGFVIDTVLKLEVHGDYRVLRCDEEDLRAKAVIMAMGSSPQPLGVPGEERFLGKGVSHCASCDGPLVAGKTVAVAGGGDSAMQETVVLAEHAAKVLVIQRGNKLDAQSFLVEAVKQRSNVEISYASEVEEIFGDNAVAAIRIKNLSSGTTRVESVAGVFVYVGAKPNTDFLDGVVALDSAGHIITDISMATSAPGIFAAGDVRHRSACLVASVIGDGATAAVSAFRYVCAAEQWRLLPATRVSH